MSARTNSGGDKGSCVCGSGMEPGDCCSRYIVSLADAPNAQALMRSRYTAYTMCNMDYLLRTWHPRTRPAQLQIDPDIRWLGLRIKRTSDGLPGDLEGRVEFVARFKVGSRAERIHENSRFVFDNGGWLYLDGDVVHQPRARPGH